MSNKRQAQVFIQPPKGDNMQQTSERAHQIFRMIVFRYTDVLKIWTIVGSIRPQGRGQAEAEN